MSLAPNARPVVVILHAQLPPEARIITLQEVLAHSFESFNGALDKIEWGLLPKATPVTPPAPAVVDEVEHDEHTLHPGAEELLAHLDTAMFSGDAFTTPAQRARLRYYLERWTNELALRDHLEFGVDRP